MGGDVTARSRSAGGATFPLWLPGGQTRPEDWDLPGDLVERLSAYSRFHLDHVGDFG